MVLSVDLYILYIYIYIDSFYFSVSVKLLKMLWSDYQFNL